MKKTLVIVSLVALVGACSDGTNLNKLTEARVDLSGAMGPATAPANSGAGSANPHPGPNYAGQWFTTTDNCSYSRAQAPGYSPTWHLILNPHHIGMPNAHSGCPVHLGRAVRL